MNPGGSVDIAGYLSVAFPTGKGQPAALSQTISEVVTAVIPVVLPAGGAVIDVVFPFPTGIAEVLFMALYTPKAIVGTHEYTADLGVPVTVGAKGLSISTYSVGDGLASLSLSNPDAMEDVMVTVTVAMQADANSIPPFWQ